jgi:hypothetical protein
MSTAMPILAAGGEDPTVKIIIGVVVAVFWIIAQVAGAVGKKPDKTVPPPEPPRPPRSQQRPPQANRPPPLRRQKTQPSRKQVPPLRPAAVQSYQAPPAARSRLAESVAESQRAIEKAASAAPKTLPRNEMINALLRPKNLRRALIVNELLQPPVALRGDRD